MPTNIAAPNSPAHPPFAVLDDRLHDEDIEEFKATVLAKLTLAVGKDAANATDRDWFVSTALALRDRIIHRWLRAERASDAKGRKRVYYLSLEFLIGRLFNDVVGNLRCGELVRVALGDLGVDPERMRSAEPDAALGNGGLGRLAACFMESMASLGIPGCGYGIRYDHGLFQQVITDGWQQEYPEQWLSFGNPWEFERPEVIYDIQFGGWVEKAFSPKGRPQSVWHAEETIKAVAYDTPVVGWRGRHVNPLRLWSARAVDPLHLAAFNEGDHMGALSPQARAEALSKVLYPADDTASGRELRLRQEYFFVSASLQDLVRRHTRTFGSIYSLPEQAAIQLNDTHPSVAIAELMRILVDLHNVPWDAAWEIIVATFSYTNHTLLPEALESWPVPLFERLLPRHLEIIYSINAHHLEAARRSGQLDPALLTELSLIDESDGRRVRMGHLAFVGSHRVNGVSVLHTELMRDSVFSQLHRLYPGRIVNKTNGISFRRWLHRANPSLTQLLCEVCGRAVLDDPAALGRLADHANDKALQERFAAVKRANKVTLARTTRERLGLNIDPGALFDVQIKRIHEYKRQLLNILDAIARYRAILADPGHDWVPRVKIFSGKAAPNYSRAKLIIKLANDVAQAINGDPLVGDRLKIVFLPNYNVSLAELIIPSADLSEQISTAGMEASGTGNMKLALNGALTMGTFDGANIEIGERVGEENIFIFGLRAEGVAERRRRGLDATDVITASPALSEVLEALATGAFSSEDPHRFAALIDLLKYSDPYMVAADFDGYRDAQGRVDEVWRSRSEWCRAALLNIAGMNWFSADRAIAEYADDIWSIPH
ncbi:MAG: glycogen/starch/alpha-glucan phosphorylase [Alphaproteobacteria bacterium]|nr:glycogen/starch/alpha-glucan phosphorylase [Alphaproteobacteria bacterium]MBV9375096.1 glycogen/starch/alpha-glucan phosphorylase [Alphaproteobacteria bacterium]